MIKQPLDKFKALRDKREWNEIRKEPGYWQAFWQATNPPQPVKSVHILRRMKS